MIKPTDEMVQLALDVFLATPTDSIAQIDAGMGKALAAVFAIVERDYRIELPGPCQSVIPTGYVRCELRADHHGDHARGATSWGPA